MVLPAMSVEIPIIPFSKIVTRHAQKCARSRCACGQLVLLPSCHISVLARRVSESCAQSAAFTRSHGMNRPFAGLSENVRLSLSSRCACRGHDVEDVACVENRSLVVSSARERPQDPYSTRYSATPDDERVSCLVEFQPGFLGNLEIERDLAADHRIHLGRR